MLPLYLTTGEPAGIGMDISLMLAERTWSRPIVVLADRDALQQRAAQLGLAVALLDYTGQASPCLAGQLYLEHVPVARSVVAGQLDV
ncbi:MAG: 4-hydroxythreonine-4-phosphate dehydrogenase PdxA, partial [Moraxellaceae bacterium]